MSLEWAGCRVRGAVVVVTGVQAGSPVAAEEEHGKVLLGAGQSAAVSMRAKPDAFARHGGGC